jgi:hypothetical protein
MSYSNPYSNPVNFEGVRERSLMFRYRLYLQYLVAQGHPRTSILSLGVKWSQVQILSARPRFAQFRGGFGEVRSRLLHTP